MILPAATFTYHMPHWHGTWRRNRGDKSRLLGLSLRFSCTTILLWRCSLHRSGKHYEDNNNTEENYRGLFALHGNLKDAESSLCSVLWKISIYWCLCSHMKLIQLVWIGTGPGLAIRSTGRIPAGLASRPARSVRTCVRPIMHHGRDHAVRLKAGTDWTAFS